jgi:MOSC domain-containing protein YiiM
LREGEVGAGDGIEPVGRDTNNISVPDIVRLYLNRNYSKADLALLHRVMALEALPDDWRSYFAQKRQLIAGRSSPA